MKQVYYHIADKEKATYIATTDKKSWHKDPVIKKVESDCNVNPERVIEEMCSMGFNMLEDPDFTQLLVSKGYCSC